MAKYLNETGLSYFWGKLKAYFVAQEAGKGLSTNDFTDALLTKLNGIAEGAEVNVQADWNQTDTTADDYIKNKPDIPAEMIAITNAEIDTIVAN